MIAVREDPAAPAGPEVESPRARDLEALHPARERQVRVGLDDQVDVVALDRDVADPEVAAAAGDREPVPDREPARPPSQLEAWPRADHDVQRMARVDRRPRLVILARARPLGWAACARTLAAVRAEVERLLRRHLEIAELVQQDARLVKRADGGAGTALGGLD